MSRPIAEETQPGRNQTIEVEGRFAHHSAFGIDCSIRNQDWVSARSRSVPNEKEGVLKRSSPRLR